MIQSNGRCLGLFALAFWAVVLVQTAPAGPPRTRSLKYDAEGRKWVELPPPAPGTAEGDLHAVRVQIAEERYRRALGSIKRFVKRYGEDDPAYAGVLIARAEALIGRRHYYKAHVALQEFLNRFAHAERTSDALRLEFVIAEAYLGGTKRKLAGLRVLSGVDLAETILDEIATDYPDDPLAAMAIKTKADHLFAGGEHALARLEYARLLRDHPNSRYRRFALKRTAEAALAGFAGVGYDEAPLIEAEERYLQYRQQYPSSADREEVGLILETIRERRAEKDLRVGAYYERTDHLGSAVLYYQLVGERWPDTNAATKAATRLERLGVLRARSSIN